MPYTYKLAGLSHQPLGKYLSALGLMAIVERHVDRYAKFWWRGLDFWCECHTPKQQLAAEIVAKLQALAIVTPWNRSSGLLWGENEIAYNKTLSSIVRSTGARRTRLRNVLSECALAMAESGLSDYPVKDVDKDLYIAYCFDRIEDGQWQQWARTTAAVVRSPKLDVRYPALLGGTGGNVASIDIAENYQTAFNLLFDDDSPTDIAIDAFANAIFDLPSDRQIQTTEVKCLHLFPADDFNLDWYFSKDCNYPPAGKGSTASINPAAIVLATEGLMTFDSATTVGNWEVAKFSLAVKTNGATVDLNLLDKRQGSTEELFLPLWKRAQKHSNLRKNLFVSPLGEEDRFYLPQPLPKINNGIDWIAAAGKWAKENRIRGNLVRYAFLPRKGKGTLAVKLETIEIGGDMPIDLLADIEPYLAYIRALKHNGSSSRMQNMYWQFEREVERFAAGEITADRFSIAAGRIFKFVAPNYKLRFDWITSVDGNRAGSTWRLAVALASCGLECLDLKFANNSSSEQIAIDLQQQWSWVLRNLSNKQNRLFAPLIDIINFIDNIDFNDSDFVDLLWAMKYMDFSMLENEVLNFIDSPEAIHRLPVAYKLGVIAINTLSRRKFKIASICESGDVSTLCTQLKNSGLQFDRFKAGRITSSRRSGAALAFPIAYNKNELKTKLLQSLGFFESSTQ